MKRFLPLLILTCLIIIFFFTSWELNAQTELRDLVLEKNDKKVTIPKGDWVVAVNIFSPDLYVGGELLGISGDGILIRESVKERERNIPFNEIGILYHGYYKENSKYIRHGVKWGGITAAGLGLIASVTTSLPAYILYGLYISAFSGLVTIPGGAIVGFIRGKQAEGDAIEYVISPNDWQINLRDISNLITIPLTPLLVTWSYVKTRHYVNPPYIEGQK